MYLHNGLTKFDMYLKKQELSPIYHKYAERNSQKNPTMRILFAFSDYQFK